MWKKKNNFESDDSESQLNNNIFLNEYYNNVHNAYESKVQSIFSNNPEKAYLIYDADNMTKISDILSIAQAKLYFMDTDKGCYSELNPDCDFHLDIIEKVISIQTDEFSANTIQSFDIIGLNDLKNDVEFAGMDGSGFAIAILDSGIDLNNSFFGPDENNDGISDRIVYSYDFTSEGDTADDTNGHGTNVSSIAASSDSQYAGVAPGADIIALQVLNSSGGGSTLGIENALKWLIDNAVEYNIVAVNMSLGYGWTSTEYISPLSDELQILKNMGVMVVVAAGNDYYEFQEEGVSALAADPSVISVGAVYDANVGSILYADGAQDYTTDEDRITCFSNRSETMVDIFAPGALITAAGIGGGLSTMAGTSQAAPHITGLVALAQEIAMRDIGRLLTQDEFVSLMISTGNTIIDGDDEDDNVVNTGGTYEVIDVYEFAKAIKSLAEDINDPLNLTVTPVTTIIEDSVSEGTVVATSSASDVDGGDIIYSIDDTINYTINTTTGVVTLTLAGAAIVNSGADLPAFNVTAQSTTGLTSSNTVNVIPPVTTDVNDSPVASNDVITVAEDTIYNGILPIYIDEDGDSVTYSLNT
ncbi:MAG: S8 family serine peptidase, partial [Sulfurovaceae bacterium]|nr:S8 family serine peptidase [Sulfurovaceae bacterium]